MSWSRYAAAGLYLIAAAVSVVLGAIYLFSSSFMPYHGDALQMDWAAVAAPLQTLILALMDVAGGGWLAVALATAVLVAIPFRRGEAWARFALPAILLAFYVPTFWATVLVTLHTPAHAPWYGNLAAIACAVIGFALDRPWQRAA